MLEIKRGGEAERAAQADASRRKKRNVIAGWSRRRPAVNE
jgi:hypothetical protein